MPRKTEEFPSPGYFAGDRNKDPIVVLGRERIAGVDSYRVKDTDGQIRTYGVSFVVVKNV